MAKYIGFGSSVKITTGATITSSSLATAVGNMLSWGGISAPVPKVDTTEIADTAETCAPGTPGAGEGTFTLGYTQGNAGVRKLIAMHLGRTIGNLFLLPGSPSTGDIEEVFKCYISNLGMEGVDRTGRYSRSVSVQPTSAIGFSTN